MRFFREGGEKISTDQSEKIRKKYSTIRVRRRDFFKRCGHGALLAGASFLSGRKLISSEKLSFLDFTSLPVRKKVRLRLFFALHSLKQDRPDWPNLGFDFQPVIERYIQVLEKKLPEFAFLVSNVSGPEETIKVLEADQKEETDGYVVFQLNCWNRVVQPVIQTGKPVLYVDFQYGGSGGFLVYTASLLRQNVENFGYLASSRMDDLVAAVRAFELYKNQENKGSFARLVERVRLERTPAASYPKTFPDNLKLISAEETVHRMKNSPILLFRDDKGGDSLELAGIPVLNLPFSELNQAWEKADPREAENKAREWYEKAVSIQNVEFSELVNSAAMYLGMKALLQKYQAMAITINCLGGFYGGHIHAYPCLGFFELNNNGLVGACEADLRSTITMVAFTLMTQGRPGYISDPVLDSSKRQIIYAHCVAANRVFGPDGPANPIEILTHSEDRQGASVRSLMPAGYLTTSLEIDSGRKEILLHQAKTVGNSSDDRACRTKLVAEPLGDFEKLYTKWDLWGWHRVTFYGDLKKPAFELGEVLGYQVVEEA
ncbi:MAG: hypothetical protein ACUVWQ_05840 [Candidatus Aminicenantales bacterium]